MMNEGMLWLDDNKDRSMEDKITRALAWYKENYGPKPTMCFVNPAAMKDKVEGEVEIEGVNIRAASFMQPNHFWVGTAAPA